jgi:hypothetical protein
LPVANYYTEVPAAKSVSEITAMLRVHRARMINTTYNPVNGEPEGIFFVVATKSGDVGFSLPANIQKVEQPILKERKKPPKTWEDDYKESMERIHTQAANTGWRIIKDWVRAQMAIIDTEIVSLEEVFLPYMEMKDGRTLFNVLEEKKFYLTEGK